MSLPYFSNRTAFFHAFLPAISIFQSHFRFFSTFPIPEFCKAKGHRGTPKGGKISLLFLSNQMALFNACLPAISIFQSPFLFLLSAKTSIFSRLKRIGVPQKEKKCHFFFSLIERDFFMHFKVPFQIFSLFLLFRSSKNQHFASQSA